MISPNDTWTLWALIASGTAVSIWLEQTYKWAARISGPVLALLIAMVLTNMGFMPVRAPAYDFVEDYLVPLAIPLLLFRANAWQIFRSTGRLFLTFHLSALGSFVGTFLAVLALRKFIPSPDIDHAAGMMAASYIGGAVNFMAIKASYQARAEVADPLIVADNFVMTGFFIVLLTIAASAYFRRHYPHPHTGRAAEGEETAGADSYWRRKEIGFLDLAKGLAVAFVAVAAAKLIEHWTRSVFGDVTHQPVPVRMLQVLCTNKFVLITCCSLLLATVFHQPMSRIQGPEEMGTYMLYLFLFCIGLPADLKAVLTQAPLFFVFCTIIAVANLGVTLLLGKWLGFTLEELLLSVNATLGGAPTAAAMAISAGWPRLVLPGILVGIWGYIIGTPVGILVVELLRR